MYATHTACCQEHRNSPTRKPKPHKVKPAKSTLKTPRALGNKPKVKASPISPVQTAITQVFNASCHKCLLRERETTSQYPPLNTGAQQREVQEGGRHHQRSIWRHPGAEVQGQTGPVERPCTAGRRSRRQTEVINRFMPVSMFHLQSQVFDCFILPCLSFPQDDPA